MKKRLNLMACGLAMAGMPLLSLGADISINGVTCSGFSSVQVTSGSNGAVNINAPGGDLLACLSAGSGQTDNPGVNDFNPSITTPVSQSVLENNTSVATLSATDSDDSAVLPMQFTIVGGADQALFTITGTSSLAFTNAPDYESPLSAAGTNVYLVEVQVSDGDLNGVKTANRTLSVTVTDDVSTDVDPNPGTNDYSPIIVGGASASFNVQEDNTAVATIVASDGDTGTGANAVTYALSGTDASLFTIGTSDGVLVFNTAPDYDDAGQAKTYTFDVDVSDNDGGGVNTTSQAVTVNVTDDVTDNLGACGAPAVGVALQPDISWASPSGSAGLIDLNNEVKSFKFTTTASTSYNGKVSVAASTGNSEVSREVWFSECPGEVAIAAPTVSTCKRNGTSSTTLYWDQGLNKSYACKLAPNTDYYLNIKNIAPASNAARCSLTDSCDVHVAFRVSGTP